MRGRVATGLAASLLGLLFAVNVYRAATQAITVDEAYTYTHFVEPPLAAMRTFYDANNHVLNTLLAKLTVNLLGVSEFTLRLPSLLGGLGYFAGLLLLSRLLFGKGVWFLVSIALNSLNPYLLDYLSCARGYGLALCFWIWALYVLLRWGDSPAPRKLPLDRRNRLSHVSVSGVLMGLCIAANLAFAPPCLAMAASWLAISTASEWHESGLFAALRRAGAGAAAQLLPAAGVAAAILWLPLQSAQRGSFYWGSPNSKEAVQSLADGVLFHGNTILNTHPFLEPFLRRAPYWLALAGFLLLAGVLVRDGLVWIRHGSLRQMTSAHFLIPGTLLATVLILLILRRGFGILYPRSRTGIYFLPLLSLPLVGLLARIDGPRLVRRAFALAGALPLVGLLGQFALQFNTSYYSDFRGDAGTKRILARLNDLRGRSPGERVRMGVSGHLRHGFEFYRLAHRLEWLELHSLDEPVCLFDYYVLLPDESSPVAAKYRLEIDYRDAVWGTALAKFVPSAVPELEELRLLGYRGGIPCGLDFKALGPVADVSRPGGYAHLLQDFLLPQEPTSQVWAAVRPSLVLRAPDVVHRELGIEFLIASAVLDHVGPQTLTFRVNGHLLDRITYRAEGRRSYRRRLPVEWLRPGGLTWLEIETDKCYTAQADGQQLCFLFLRASLGQP